jgi:prevent-host-death family protein
MAVGRPLNTLSTNVISAGTARTKLGQVLRRTALKNERFIVEHRGQPTAVIMSIKDYVDTIAPTPAWLKAIGAEAERTKLNKLTMRQIDAEVSAARRERRRNSTDPTK